MESYFIFKSKRGNNYLYSLFKKEFLFINENLKLLINQFSQGKIPEQIPSNFKLQGKTCIYNLNSDVDKFLFLKNNNYFKSISYNRFSNYSFLSDINENMLSSVKHVLFEVTDLCNFKCDYCINGKLYTNHNHGTHKKLSFDLAKTFIDYLIKLWEPTCKNKVKNVIISFYGGEPLLNISLISQIISYIRRIQNQQLKFTFSLTTNGYFLDKYIGYLVENDFSISVSLDGNIYNNSHRINRSGQNTFNKVFMNLLMIKENYKEFFAKNLQFISVLNDNNSYAEIFNFFHKNFKKYPEISEISRCGISRENEDFFNSIYKNCFKSYLESLSELDNIPFIKKNKFIISFLYNIFITHSVFWCTEYLNLFTPNNNNNYLPTGTCIPFENKIMLSVDGKIYPCERVGNSIEFGNLSGGKVNIENKKIVKIYNKYYKYLSENCCNECYIRPFCTSCMFQTNPIQKEKCNSFQNKESYLNNLTQFISFLEECPNFYKILVQNHKRM